MVDETLRRNGIETNNLKLLISDFTRYMQRYGRFLNSFYPHLINEICILHISYNCAMKLRNHYRHIDDIISFVKAIPVKHTTIMNTFTEIGIPPEPILTRWGAWLKAIEY